MYPPEILEASLANYQRFNTPEDCDKTASTRHACAVMVYQRFYQLFMSSEALGLNEPLSFGELMTMIFTRELGQVLNLDPRAANILLEAYLRNLWFICSADKIFGCSPNELLRFLAAKQAWYRIALNLNADQDVKKQEAQDLHWIDLSLRPNNLALMEKAFLKSEWYDSRDKNGVLRRDVPFEWANWDCNNKSYGKLKNNVLADQKFPLKVFFCAPNKLDEGANLIKKGWEYYFAVVTQAQNELLGPPSTSSMACSTRCKANIEVFINPDAPVEPAKNPEPISPQVKQEERAVVCWNQSLSDGMQGFFKYNYCSHNPGTGSFQDRAYHECIAQNCGDAQECQQFVKNFDISSIPCN